MDTNLFVALGATGTLIGGVVAAVVAAVKLPPEAAERAAEATAKGVITLDRIVEMLDKRVADQDVLLAALRAQNFKLEFELDETRRDRDKWRSLYDIERHKIKE